MIKFIEIFKLALSDFAKTKVFRSILIISMVLFFIWLFAVPMVYIFNEWSSYIPWLDSFSPIDMSYSEAFHRSYDGVGGISAAILASTLLLILILGPPIIILLLLILLLILLTRFGNLINQIRIKYKSYEDEVDGRQGKV